MNIVDGGGSGSADGSGSAACLASTSYGAVTPTQTEGHFGMTQGATAIDNYYLFADLNADASPDLLLVDLYDGYGVFTDGIVPGTYSLTGDEADFALCGACVEIQTDYTADGQTGTPYLAVGGSLTLTSATMTSIAGSLSNVNFKHLKEDGMDLVDANDGCTAMLGSISFTATPDRGSEEQVGVQAREDEPR